MNETTATVAIVAGAIIGGGLLRATRFEDRHLRMAEIVGRSGLKLPKTARDALLKTLGSLASIVTITQ